jgi:DNA-entry nuclease
MRGNNVARGRRKGSKRKKHHRLLWLIIICLIGSFAVHNNGDWGSEDSSVLSVQSADDRADDSVVAEEGDDSKEADDSGQETEQTEESGVAADAIPEFSGDSVIEINNNEPSFSEEDKERTDGFETYSELDSLGRCGVAYANICEELMPTEERGKIGQVKPSGWHTVKYNGIVEGNYLYNRCHLIGFQLAGENANEKNLITGTRYFNAGDGGMLPYENEVAEYVKSTGNHVLYRVTPVFEGNNLVAKGVQMEAYSVEDNGKGISFHIFVYNVQPGIGIDYATGDSWLDDSVVVNDVDSSKKAGD